MKKNDIKTIKGIIPAMAIEGHGERLFMGGRQLGKNTEFKIKALILFHGADLPKVTYYKADGLPYTIEPHYNGDTLYGYSLVPKRK